MRVVQRFEAAGVRPYEELGVLLARESLEAVTRLQNDPIEIASVRDILVPGPAGLLPARVYHPQPDTHLPVVVYFHGGGWVLGSVRTADGPCRRLAGEGRCVVVSLEYRRAPETQFPGPLLDCVSALCWVADNAAELGGDADRVVVMGDSAGGNLAAGAAMQIRDDGGPSIAAQVLVYPCLAPALGSAFPSYADFADGPLLTRSSMTWFWEQYLGTGGEPPDHRAAPLWAADFSNLPPATVVVAELDPLRDEGIAFAERLRSGGTPAVTTTYRGAAHGFWWMDKAMRQADELTVQLGSVIRNL
ncbi:MAG: alpha/beta hydrolase [Acidimicrobiales bacterium]